MSVDKNITLSLDEYCKLKSNSEQMRDKEKNIEEMKIKCSKAEEEVKRLKQENLQLRENDEKKELELATQKVQFERIKSEIEKTKQEKALLETKLEYMNRDLMTLKKQYNEINDEIIGLALVGGEESNTTQLFEMKGLSLEKEERKKPRQPTKERKKEIKKKTVIDDDETDTIEDITLKTMREHSEEKKVDLEETEELSTSVLFKNPQKCVFDVNYNLVIDVMKKIIEQGKSVARIKGFPSILAVDVFKEYTRLKGINIYDGIKGEKERKNHLRYNVGSFNKCLKKLEDARLKKGFPETIRVVTSCYVYIQCIGDQFKVKPSNSTNSLSN
ncbi:hypothetical protein ENUP19_0317G0080 [Entamoeba nuttalli]|uniref:Uncharacterized protein n=2 Tax=Entamoeba nuttalli TaxID=412467 RepID=K2HPC4_ENTNP|nr:hypothetical protein ENU1_188610 [Entamoeba nuttalli P19]EKE37710.1 hypothetical protein ENU1_188610 [Entamoeba nuttalli P19]|eukprot:XP_008859956.1 hypothetical protein ENU1_188610 [Entamoeba nuttalli P19]